MDIQRLAGFLSTQEGCRFFEDLKKTGDLSVNRIALLKKENPDYPVADLLTLNRIQKNLLYRIPAAENYLFTERSAQQASSIALARYHAGKLSAHGSVADLCCGCGMDLIQLAGKASRVFAVDIDEDLLTAASYNARISGLTNIRFCRLKAEDFNIGVDAIYADPDRRKKDRRITEHWQYSPPLSQIIELRSLTENIMIKISPVEKFDRIGIPCRHTFEFISENRVLKEILVCLGKFTTRGVARKAVLLPGKLELTDQGNPDVRVGSIDKYLYEPDPAVIRSGLVKQLAARLKADMIDPRSALLTGSRIQNSGFIRNFRVDEIHDFSLRDLRRLIREKQIGDLVIKTRGFPEPVESFRKKLHPKGKKRSVLFLLKLENQRIMVFTDSVPSKI